LDNMHYPTKEIIDADHPLMLINGQVKIRKMTEDDVDRICLMERQCFKAPWPSSSFLAELAADYSKCFVITNYEHIIGYAVAWYIVDEFHLANIAIDAEYRKKGIGEWFVKRLLELASQLNKKNAYLEVRRSNIPAIRLYEKLGFSIIDIRKNYYTTEKEDALIMRRPIN
jgi:[ribosomal protein S18]-alanine N-acetyltransferase